MESTNNTKTMENTNNTLNGIFAEMDNAVDNLFNAIDNTIKKIEEEKMVFTITRTEHYKGDKPKGVLIVECFEFEALADYGVEVDKSFARAKFPNNHGRGYKGVREMTCGTILKLQAGEYIQRIK